MQWVLHLFINIFFVSYEYALICLIKFSGKYFSFICILCIVLQGVLQLNSFSFYLLLGILTVQFVSLLVVASHTFHILPFNRIRFRYHLVLRVVGYLAFHVSVVWVCMCVCKCLCVRVKFVYPSVCCCCFLHFYFVYNCINFQKKNV